MIRCTICEFTKGVPYAFERLRLWYIETLQKFVRLLFFFRQDKWILKFSN